MMELLVHLGGESQIQKERRKPSLGRIDGSMFVISWEWNFWDISQGKAKSQSYERNRVKRINESLLTAIRIIVG